MKTVDQLLSAWGMKRENWECDPGFVSDLIMELDSRDDVSERDKKDAARYRFLADKTYHLFPNAGKEGGKWTVYKRVPDKVIRVTDEEWYETCDEAVDAAMASQSNS